MSSFKSFFEASASVDKVTIRQLLQNLSDALVPMQMKEKGSVIGTANYMPPENLRYKGSYHGMASDSSTAWQMLVFTMKGTKMQPIAEQMSGYFQQMLDAWDRFTRKLNVEHHIRININNHPRGGENDSTRVESADIDPRIVRHSYDKINRELGKRHIQQTMNQNRQMIARDKANFKPDVNPETINHLRREQVEELWKKFEVAKRAFKECIPVMEDYLGYTQSAGLWNNFMNYSELWAKTVRKALPQMLKMLPTRPAVPTQPVTQPQSNTVPSGSTYG